MTSSRRAWMAVLWSASLWLGNAAATSLLGPATGPMPASFEGTLPGADSPVAWHLDLLPEGRFQLRRSFTAKPAPNAVDELGLWTWDGTRRRFVLKGGSDSPVYLEATEPATLLKLDNQGRRIDSAQPHRLTRLAAFAPIEPQGTFTGHFTYLADAAVLKLCADGRRLPVAMEGEYRALESAYSALGLPPGQGVLTGVEGRITMRPSAEPGQPDRATMVVSRFVGLYPREHCGQPLATSPLRGTYWKLVRLEGQPVAAADRQREPHLILDTRSLRVKGSGGCNRLMGGFTLDGERLQFQGLAGTRMACPGGMEQEQRFLQALARSVRWQVQGSHLELMDEGGAVLARLEATAMR